MWKKTFNNGANNITDKRPTNDKNRFFLSRKIEEKNAEKQRLKEEKERLEREKNKKVIIGCGAVVAVLMAFIFVMGAIENNNSKSDETTEQLGSTVSTTENTVIETLEDNASNESSESLEESSMEIIQNGIERFVGTINKTYNEFTGHTIYLELVVEPSGIEEGDYTIEDSNPGIVYVSHSGVYENDDNSSKILLTLEMSKPGNTSFSIMSTKDNSIQTGEIIFNVAQAKVSKIERKAQVYGVEYGNTNEMKWIINPETEVSVDDFEINMPNDTNVKIVDRRIEESEGKVYYIAEFEGIRNETTTTEVVLSTTDGAYSSYPIEVGIREQEGSTRIVYITEYGKKYHYSESCAGEGSTQITEGKAKKMLLQPCSKCVY